MKKYIVTKNGSFEVIESEKAPLNLVLVEPNKTYNDNTYVLVNNDVRVSWLDDYQWNGKYKCLTVMYRGAVLLEVNALKNIQIVIDALNEYRDLKEEELEQRYQKAIVRIKSELENEIERLTEEKKKLTEETEKYRDIVKKVKDIFLIFNELDKSADG